MQVLCLRPIWEVPCNRKSGGLGVTICYSLSKFSPKDQVLKAWSIAWWNWKEAENSKWWDLMGDFMSLLSKEIVWLHLFPLASCPPRGEQLPPLCTPTMMWCFSSQAQKLQSQMTMDWILQAVNQNKLFLFWSWWSQACCYSNRKLISVPLGIFSWFCSSSVPKLLS